MNLFFKNEDDSRVPDFDIKTGITDGSAAKGILGYYIDEGTVIELYGERYNSDNALIKGEKVTGEDALEYYLESIREDRESDDEYIKSKAGK
jgi:hypothetical protein